MIRPAKPIEPIPFHPTYQAATNQAATKKCDRMPIKFRCMHCRQFLGISRSKAGSIVDCPTCGRAIRVPLLDGRVDPIPQPQMNLQDSQLANALDELASIGEVAVIEVDEGPIENIHNLKTRESDTREPAPLPEPVAIDPPLPAEVANERRSSAVIPVTTVDPADHVSRGTGGDNDPPALPAARDEDPLASLAAAAPPGVGIAADPASKGWQSLLALPVLLAMCVVFVIGFAMGTIIGRLDDGQIPTDGNPSTDVEAGGQQHQPSPDGGAAESITKTPALRGHITYKTAAGENRPDRGARVIVLLQNRQGQAKLSAIGFRAADSEADVKLATASLRALSGDVAVVDDEGNFEITLPAAGTYHVLVVSHYQSCGENAAPDKEFQKVLESYFDKPEQLLGSLCHQFSQVRYKGHGTELWDHSFALPE